MTRLEPKVSEGPPKGVGLGRGKRCPLRPEGGVKGHTLQRHPPHSHFPLELSSVRTRLEPAGSTGTCSVVHIDQLLGCRAGQSTVRVGDSGGASGMYNSHFYEHSKRLLELVSGGREDMSPVNDPIT